MDAGPRWELLYWKSLPGRGDFVRLMFEEAGVPYDDVCRIADSHNACLQHMKGEAEGFPVLYPPIIKRGDFVLNETTAILVYLGKQFGMYPSGGAEEEAHALQLALSAANYIGEGHDCFHPLKKGGTYDSQKEEAKPFIEAFRTERIPKFLSNFEKVLKLNNNGEGFFFGTKVTYADIAVFQVLRATEFQFLEEYKSLPIPLLRAFSERMKQHPRIKAYLESDRCMPFCGNSMM